MKSVARILARPFIFAYNKTHWFTDKEAWGIYRFFAIGEAVGWTLLIGAIIYRRVGLPEAASVVSFAGHIHGMLFLLYFLMTLLVARSMGWGIKRVGLSIIAGMPPYGSVIFEQLMAKYRKKRPSFVAPPRGIED